MKHPEREFEQRCVAEARRQGWTCWKNEHNGLKGIPDYSMLHPDGRFILVEFKRPDGKGRASPLQLVWLERFPNTVKMVDDWDTSLAPDVEVPSKRHVSQGPTPPDGQHQSHHV